MGFLADFLIKGVIGGAGQVIAASASRIFGFALTDKMIAQLIIGFAEMLAKRTKNTIDDNAIATWKEQIIKSVIDIK